MLSRRWVWWLKTHVGWCYIHYFPSIWETRHPPKRRRDGFGRYKSTARVFGFCFGFSPLSWTLKVVKKEDWCELFGRKTSDDSLDVFSRFSLFLGGWFFSWFFFSHKFAEKNRDLFATERHHLFWFLKCHISSAEQEQELFFFRRWRMMISSWFLQLPGIGFFHCLGGHLSSWSVGQLVICNIYVWWMTSYPGDIINHHEDFCHEPNQYNRMS